MKRILAIVVIGIILLSGMRAIAQTETSPVFKPPVLDDFLTELDGLFKSPDTLKQVNPNFIDAAEAEFVYRYLPQTTYAERRRAFDIFKTPEFGFQTVTWPEIDQDKWISWLLDAWFAENPIDLDAWRQIHFDDFDAVIEPRDFSGDGQHEWLLDLTKGANGDDFEYRNWMVIARKGDIYDAIPVPIWPGWHGSWNFPTAYSERPAESGFEDITDDGVPEWFIGRGVSPWGNTPGVYSSESILSWQDGAIVNLMPYAADQVGQANLDDDPALELYQADWSYDSWGCGTNPNSVWDWDGKAFVLLEQPIMERKNCEGRDAEEAMWRGDFATAVENYNTYLAAHDGDYTDYIDCVASDTYIDFCPYSDVIVIHDYFLARRVIAYALLGDESKTRASLQALSAITDPGNFQQAILSANTTDAKTLCQTAYDYYVQNPYGDAFFDTTMKNFFTPGDIYEDATFYMTSDIIFAAYKADSIKAGCDITIFAPEPSPTPTPIPPTYTPYPTPKPEQNLIHEPIAPYFRSGDYETALWIAENLAKWEHFDPTQAPEMDYWRALSLEALGRDDESAAAYAKVAQDAPDTVWAELAMLHF